MIRKHSSNSKKNQTIKSQTCEFIPFKTKSLQKILHLLYKNPAFSRSMTIRVQNHSILESYFFSLVSKISSYMTFAQHQTLFFCEFGVLQSHSIILQKLHSGSINGFQHTALYFATYRIRIYPDQ